VAQKPKGNPVFSLREVIVMDERRGGNRMKNEKRIRVGYMFDVVSGACLIGGRLRSKQASLVI